MHVWAQPWSNWNANFHAHTCSHNDNIEEGVEPFTNDQTLYYYISLKHAFIFHLRYSKVENHCFTEHAFGKGEEEALEYIFTSGTDFADFLTGPT